MGWVKGKVMKYGGGAPESPLSMGPERLATPLHVLEAFKVVVRN